MKSKRQGWISYDHKQTKTNTHVKEEEIQHITEITLTAQPHLILNSSEHNHNN